MHKERTGKPFLLANGGLSQAYQTCTASRTFPLQHPYLENTIASMKAAFQLRADIVEFDIQPTKDGQFVVFHEGNGSEEFSSGFDSSEDLKRLPAGYTGGLWTNRIDQIAPVLHDR